jgi:agmatinase
MTNYGGIPEEFSDLKTAKVVILPVPYDGTSTWIKGADKGPEAILEASANMELYDIESNREIYTIGIHTAEPITEKSSPEAMTEAVYREAKKYVGKQHTVVIGGEHSVSFGTIKAHFEIFKDMCVLQFDAHTDLRPEYEHSKYNHACVMARAQELCPVIHVGIRSQCIEEQPNVIRENVFFAHEIYNNNEWIDKAISRLSKNVYISFDLDAFDPSILPSTGTPEPGGMGWYQVLAFLQKVYEKRNVVGFDVVELCPNEQNPASDFLTSKLIYKMIGYKFKN